MKTSRVVILTLLMLLMAAIILMACGSGEQQPSRLAVATAAGDTNVTNLVASGYIVAYDSGFVSSASAAATATPAFWIDAQGSTNDALVISKAGTPTFKVGNTGALTTGAQTLSGGLTVNNWARVAAPTAIALATPAAWVDNLGAGNDALVVSKASTPVFTVGNAGAVAGVSIDTSSFTSIGTFLALEAASPITVTGGSTITPVGSMQPIVSATPVTTSTSTAVANGTRVGDLVILRNDNASDAITIDGTGGNVECGADKVLGPKDSIMIVWSGSDWMCIAASDN